MSNAQVVTRGSIHPQSFPGSLHPQSFPDSSHPQSFPDSSHPQSFPDFVRQLSSNRNTIILERKMERHKIIYQNNNKGSILQWNCRSLDSNLPFLEQYQNDYHHQVWLQIEYCRIMMSIRLFVPFYTILILKL